MAVQASLPSPWLSSMLFSDATSSPTERFISQVNSCRPTLSFLSLSLPHSVSLHLSLSLCPPLSMSLSISLSLPPSLLRTNMSIIHVVCTFPAPACEHSQMYPLLRTCRSGPVVLGMRVARVGPTRAVPILSCNIFLSLSISTSSILFVCRSPSICRSPSCIRTFSLWRLEALERDISLLLSLLLLLVQLLVVPRLPEPPIGVQHNCLKLPARARTRR